MSKVAGSVSDLVAFSSPQGSTATQDAPTKPAPKGMIQTAPETSSVPNLPAGFAEFKSELENKLDQQNQTIQKLAEQLADNAATTPQTNGQADTNKAPTPPKEPRWKSLQDYIDKNGDIYNSASPRLKRDIEAGIKRDLEEHEKLVKAYEQAKIQFEERENIEKVRKSGVDITASTDSSTPAAGSSVSTTPGTSDGSSQPAEIEAEIAKYPGLQSLYAGLSSEPLKEKLRNDFKSWQVTFEKMSKDTDYTNTYSHIQDLLQTGDPNMQTTIQDYVNEYEGALSKASTKQRDMEKKKLDARAAGKPADTANSSNSGNGVLGLTNNGGSEEHVNGVLGQMARIGLPIASQFAIAPALKALGPKIASKGGLAGLIVGGILTLGATVLGRYADTGKVTLEAEDALAVGVGSFVGRGQGMALKNGAEVERLAAANNKRIKADKKAVKLQKKQEQEQLNASSVASFKRAGVDQDIDQQIAVLADKGHPFSTQQELKRRLMNGEVDAVDDLITALATPQRAINQPFNGIKNWFRETPQPSRASNYQLQQAEALRDKMIEAYPRATGSALAVQANTVTPPQLPNLPNTINNNIPLNPPSPLSGTGSVPVGNAPNTIVQQTTNPANIPTQIEAPNRLQQAIQNLRERFNQFRGGGSPPNAPA